MCQLRVHQGGFSLIELILAIVLIGILAGLTAPIISQGLAAGETTRSNLHTQEKLQQLLQRLSYEIREIDNNGTNYMINTMSATNLSFTRNDSAATRISIGYAGTTVSLGYSSPAQSAVLSDEVSSFNFAYFDSNSVVTTSNSAVAYVEISAGLQNADSGAVYSRRARIALRDRG